MTTARQDKSPKKTHNFFLPLLLALLVVAAGLYLFSSDANHLLDTIQQIVFVSNDNTTVQQSPSQIATQKDTAIQASVTQEKEPHTQEKEVQQPGSIATSTRLQAPAKTESTNSAALKKQPQLLGAELPETTQQKNDITQESSLNTSAVLTVSEDSANIPPSQDPLETIAAFYTHLDQQKYLAPYKLDVPSEQYFSNLLQKIIDNPPIVTGETDDLFNILQNTAHFFRIVGKKNINVLRIILDKENDSLENILAQLYQATNQSDQLKSRFGITLPPTAIYDYAGFFLTTMGGRLYLFRRNSTLRMAVSYYSIRVIDKANDHGENSHGIDIFPAIKQLISEIENSGASLKMQEQYLDTLYTLKEKYNR